MARYLERRGLCATNRLYQNMGFIEKKWKEREQRANNENNPFILQRLANYYYCCRLSVP
jgi:hypothetical protein